LRVSASNVNVWKYYDNRAIRYQDGPGSPELFGENNGIIFAIGY
jgi:hypothetical protein